MIGSQISGTDIHGATCTGKILDKVLCLQSVSLPAPPGVIGGRPQIMPIALDAYMIEDTATGEIHFINPAFINWPKNAEIIDRLEAFLKR